MTCRGILGALCAAVVALVGAVSVVPAQQRTVTVPTRQSGFEGTPHDFRRSMGSGEQEQKEVCVFCHAPTGGRVSGDGPAWQRAVQPELSYQVYATQDDPLAFGLGFDVAGMSVVCLSCHDAVQAATVTSLVDDHPFGIPYRGALAMMSMTEDLPRYVPPEGGGPYRQANAVLFNTDFKRPASGVVDGRVVWWAPAGPPGSQRTRADLPLYTRRAGSIYDDVPFVECGSCHDPHSQTRLFLRLGTDGSLACKVCHQK